MAEVAKRRAIKYSQVSGQEVELTDVERAGEGEQADEDALSGVQRLPEEKRKGFSFGCNIPTCLLLCCIVAAVVGYTIYSCIAAWQRDKGSMEGAEPEDIPGWFVFIDQQNSYIHQANWWVWLGTFLNSASAANYQKAQAYYQQQLPLFSKAIEENPLHFNVMDPRYRASVPPGGSASYYDLVKLRAESLLQLYKEKKWDGFRIEKSKCDMARFIELNKIPMSPVLGYWDSTEALLKELPETLQYSKVILKCCHLTAGSAASTRMITRDKLKDPEYMKELHEWMDQKWDFRVVDWHRTWHVPMDQMTDHVPKGFMVQRLHPFTTEVKCQTLFGRVYMLVVHGGQGSPSGGVWYHGAKHFEVYGGGTDTLLNIAHEDTTDYQWIIDEGHIPRILWLAELTAKATGLDELRVDIFLTQGNPDAAVINENSISSGLDMRVHFPFYSKMWAQGLHHPKLSERPTKKQLYEQTAFDEESKMVRPEEPPYVAKGPVWSPTGEKLLDKDNGL